MPFLVGNKKYTFDSNGAVCIAQNNETILCYARKIGAGYGNLNQYMRWVGG